MKKALLITFYFPPCGSSSTARNLGFARHLKAFDIEPTVLTAEESIFSRLPLLRRDDSYRDLLKEIKIKRTPTLIPAWLIRLLFRLGMSRLVKFIFPVEPYIFWIIPSFLSAIRTIRTEAIDVIITTSLPNTPHLCGYLLKIATGKPWIADFQDPMSFRLSDVWATRVSHWIISFLERMILSKADGVTVQSDTARDILLEKYPFIKSDRIRTLTNGFDVEVPEPPRVYDRGGRFRIVHSGEFYSELGSSSKRAGALKRLLSWPLRALEYTYAKADLYPHSAEKLFKVALILKKRHPEIIEDIEIVLNGHLSPEALAAITSLKINDIIKTTGLTSYDESLEIIGSADLLYLPLFVDPVHKRNYCTPGKLFPYMTSLKPILAPIQDGDTKDLLSNAGIACFLDPYDDVGLAEKIYEIYRKSSENDLCFSPDISFIAKFARKETVRVLAEMVAQTSLTSTARRELRPEVR